MANALIDSVLHWRRKLDKDPDDDYILNAIRKLSKVPMTIEILEATHIGRTIRKLSKRDDIVGEKAKTVLNKWREVFASQGSDKNQKVPSDSKKENVNKDSKSSNKYLSHEKTNHSQKSTSHNHEHKHKNSVSPSLSEQSSKKYINGNCNTNSSSPSGHKLYQYDVSERNSKYLDYDPHTESSEGYNPECPELFPSDKPVKTKKTVLVETYEPSSVKRKSTDDKQQNEDKSHQKKFKSSSHSNSDNAVESSKKSSEKKDKHSVNKEKTKDSSHSSTLKKDSNNKVKSHSESTKKHESASDAKKTKCKESSSESDKTKSKKTKVKSLQNLKSTEEFTSSEVSFEDCLGFNDIVTLKKSSKSSSKKQSSSNTPSKERPTEKSKKDPPKTVSPDQKMKVSKDSSSHHKKEKVSKDSSVKSKASKDSHSNKEVPFIVPKPSTKLDVADITSTLPEIQPNYRPLPRSPDFYAPKKKDVMSNEEAIMFTTSRREKTAVYSGKKNAGTLTSVLPLFQCCIRVLIENIDNIECVGNCSYQMLQPVLERCTPSQLYNIENYNPHFIEDTNHLWEAHCKRDYKLLKPMEHETWRELYWRAHDEREKKLKSVTAHISKSISTSTPVRQVKLAYVESGYVKPPRDVARKQAKHGTAAKITPIKPGVPIKVSKPASPAASSPAASSSAVASSSTITSHVPASNNFKQKPKVAPLMAKTLKSLKAFRR